MKLLRLPAKQNAFAKGETFETPTVRGQITERLLLPGDPGHAYCARKNMSIRQGDIYFFEYMQLWHRVEYMSVLTPDLWLIQYTGLDGQKHQAPYPRAFSLRSYEGGYDG